MLFRQRFLDGIRDGTITLAFRRWRRPSVRAGGTLLTAAGQLGIASVDEVALARISEGDAHHAGYASRAELLDVIRTRPGVRAGDLCDLVGLELPPFKLNVRKLKTLGLTESLEVGYRLSPRGASFMRFRDKKD